ncbi:MAG TPA: HupE/UreJ family protein [Steroidobacteraceae bacterium]|nr:HupE/UreJ family protein [Steroidobacteraceae bacterium]
MGARLMRAALIVACLFSAVAAAHDVAISDRQFVQSVVGPTFLPFLYLGAKHMVTGYDHVLFLIGVVFFLYRLRDIVIYVSMFTIGHSLTLMGGVLFGIGANAHIVDAIIGLSVVYKGVENLGGIGRLGLSINTKLAILVFGLFHGLGLATKLEDLSISPNGLLVNLVGFNVGVEVGQILVLLVIVTLLNLWRTSVSFATGAGYANGLLIVAGLLLTGIQIAGYIRS